jgi:hypothetical protein
MWDSRESGQISAPEERGPVGDRATDCFPYYPSPPNAFAA